MCHGNFQSHGSEGKCPQSLGMEQRGLSASRRSSKPPQPLCSHSKPQSDHSCPRRLIYSSNYKYAPLHTLPSPRGTLRQTSQKDDEVPADTVSTTDDSQLPVICGLPRLMAGTGTDGIGRSWAGPLEYQCPVTLSLSHTAQQQGSLGRLLCPSLRTQRTSQDETPVAHGECKDSPASPAASPLLHPQRL